MQSGLKHHNHLKEPSFGATLITRKLPFYPALPGISWIVLPSFFLQYKTSQERPVYDTMLFSNAFYPPVCHEFQETRKSTNRLWMECIFIIWPTTPIHEISGIRRPCFTFLC